MLHSDEIQRGSKAGFNSNMIHSLILGDLQNILLDSYVQK